MRISLAAPSREILALLLVTLMQCYATRSQSGCEPLSYPPSMAECQPLARQYQREDRRALAVTRLPAVVSYHCVKR